MVRWVVRLLLLRDSFVSRAKIRAVDLSTDRMRIVEEHDIELAALEFGGNMQRL